MSVELLLILGNEGGERGMSVQSAPRRHRAASSFLFSSPLRSSSSSCEKAERERSKSDFVDDSRLTVSCRRCLLPGVVTISRFERFERFERWGHLSIFTISRFSLKSRDGGVSVWVVYVARQSDMSLRIASSQTAHSRRIDTRSRRLCVSTSRCVITVSPPRAVRSRTCTHSAQEGLQLLFISCASTCTFRAGYAG